MKQHILSILAITVSLCGNAQSNGKLVSQPFAIHHSSGELAMAGKVNTFVYANYSGKDVAVEIGSDPHERPEFLIYELFRNLKSGNLEAVQSLYDTTFSVSAFQSKFTLKGVTDIKFRSR